MIGFGPVSRPPPRRAAVMRAGANGPVGGGSTSENHRMPDIWPHRNRLLGRPFPLAGSSSKVAKSQIKIHTVNNNLDNAFRKIHDHFHEIARFDMSNHEIHSLLNRYLSWTAVSNFR